MSGVRVGFDIIVRSQVEYRDRFLVQLLSVDLGVGG